MTTPTKAQKITAAAVSGVALAAMFSAGAATGRASAPSIGYSPASAYGSPYGTPTSGPTPTASSDPYGIPTSAPTASAPPKAPSLYGNHGLAAEIARERIEPGYDSMSAACAAGVKWTCDITEVKSSTDSMRTVTIGRDPDNGDEIAREFLARAPRHITSVRVQYVQHGTTPPILPPEVGTASRSSK